MISDKAHFTLCKKHENEVSSMKMKRSFEAVPRQACGSTIDYHSKRFHIQARTYIHTLLREKLFKFGKKILIFLIRHLQKGLFRGLRNWVWLNLTTGFTNE
jgi:hypothetical protein